MYKARATLGPRNHNLTTLSTVEQPTIIPNYWPTHTLFSPFVEAIYIRDMPIRTLKEQDKKESEAEGTQVR
jgi:hypothetical protein